MFFGELTADSGISVPKSQEQVFQGFYQVMRSLIYNKCTGFVFKGVKYLAPFFFVRRQKCFKCKASGRKSGESERSYACTCSGEGCDRDTCFVSHFYQLFARIGYGGCAGIGYERDILTFKQFCYESPSFIYFIVLMIAGHGSFYLKVIKQFYAVSGVLCSYKVDLF